MILVATVLSIAFGLRHSSTRGPDLSAPPPRTAFRITRPGDREAVGASVEVRGASPFGQLHHYILVTSAKTGQTWVAGEAFVPGADGAWSQLTQLGTGAGKPEAFVIQVVATSLTLGEGELASRPEHSEWSNSVTVTRSLQEDS